MKTWDGYWAAWMVLVAMSFAWLEGSALADHQPDRTLTRRLRAWLGLAPRRPWRHVTALLFLVAVGGFAAWFAAHIVGGWGA